MKIAALVVALVASVSFATSSDAAVFKVTYNGTVSSGTDITGAFGAPDSNLAGKSFTATFVFDTSLGYHPLPAVPPNSDKLQGGPYFGNTNPLLSTTLSIGSSAAVAVMGSYGGYVETIFNQPPGSLNEYYASARGDVAPLEQLYAFIRSGSGTFPNGSTVDSLFNYIAQSGDVTGGFFQLYDYSASKVRAFGELQVSEVAVSDVPLPAALPLFASSLITGGFLVWRRRKPRHAIDA